MIIISVTIILYKNKQLIMMSAIEKWTQEYSILFITNRMELRRAAYRILGDWERSDDIVQDAYIKLTELSSIQNVRQPLPYFFRIVRNLAIDHYRRIALESQLFGLDEEGANIPTLIDSPETTAINRELLERVAEVLTKLPDRTRQVFELYRIDEYTHRMIAEELGISISLANILIRKATDQCRSIL